MAQAVIPLSGAILCGGASRRMGQDKATLIVDGETLLQRAIARMRTVADPVILAAAGMSVDAPPGCVVVHDAVRRGPLAGIPAALRASPHSLCAVVAVDMPDLSPALLRALAERWHDEDA